jgi:hypothetical protein
MTYLPTMGDTETIAFNSTKYPGICKPSNQTTLQAVYDLQNQCNRIAKMKGGKIIAQDGDIGPGTLSAARFAAGYLGPLATRLAFSTSNCTDLGANIVAFTDAVRASADALGAPAKVDAPVPARAPMLVMPSGLEVKGGPPIGASALDSIKNLGMPTLIALGVAAVGVGYYVTRKTK